MSEKGPMSARSSPTRFWEIFRCIQWPPGPRCSGRLEHAWCSGQRSERERRSGCVAVLDRSCSGGGSIRLAGRVPGGRAQTNPGRTASGPTDCQDRLWRRGQRGAAVHGVAEQRRGYLWSRGVAGEVGSRKKYKIPLEEGAKSTTTKKLNKDQHFKK